MSVYRSILDSKGFSLVSPGCHWLSRDLLTSMRTSKDDDQHASTGCWISHLVGLWWMFGIYTAKRVTVQTQTLIFNIETAEWLQENSNNRQRVEHGKHNDKVQLHLRSSLPFGSSAVMMVRNIVYLYYPFLLWGRGEVHLFVCCRMFQ